MGTFAGHTGKWIYQKKEGMLASKMMKILNYGGMMQFERLFGHLMLLYKPRNCRVKVRWISWYNYFEESTGKMQDFM